MYDLLVFIGRFQPFHTEHERIVETALQKARKVLVLIGSSGKAPTVRNPFSFEQRKQMIETTFANDLNRLIIQPLRDITYNDVAWIRQVQRQVNEVILDTVNNGGFRACGIKDARVGLIGMNKDHTSYYLKMFPQFESVPVSQVVDLSSTEIRNQLFTGRSIGKYSLPSGTARVVEAFVQTPLFRSLKDEYAFVEQYKQQWKNAPYPVKHVTVDAVVVQSGHILLVKRRSEPGKGLLALPGGHLNPDEKIVDGMIRELREETKIKVPEPVLRGSIVSSSVFDDPHRSTLGRVITHAFLVQLADQNQLPKVKGSDDAEKAMWIPLADLQEDKLFDDHFAIVNYFLKLEASD